ncbi:class I SAM-dependent methyltransferase [Flavobacteriaceae bacterium MHTCC 0001]
MDRQYYNAYFKLERNHWWFKVREKIIFERIKRLLDKPKDLKVLNIGAATGKTSQMLSYFGEVTSIEYDQTCCDFVQEKLAIPIVNASITDLPLQSSSYDLVCAFDVIEHVEDDALAIREMKRVCKNGGVICVTVPAYMTLWSNHDDVNKHFRRYILGDIIRLFKSCNLNNVYSSYFNTILFLPILMFRKVSNIIPKKYIRQGAGSDFELKGQHNFINSFLGKIFSLEIILLRYFKFLFGVSIITLWKK